MRVFGDGRRKLFPFNSAGRWPSEIVCWRVDSFPSNCCTAASILVFVRRLYLDSITSATPMPSPSLLPLPPSTQDDDPTHSNSVDNSNDVDRVAPYFSHPQVVLECSIHCSLNNNKISKKKKKRNVSTISKIEKKKPPANFSIKTCLASKSCGKGK